MALPLNDFIDFSIEEIEWLFMNVESNPKKCIKLQHINGGNPVYKSWKVVTARERERERER